MVESCELERGPGPHVTVLSEERINAADSWVAADPEITILQLTWLFSLAVYIQFYTTIYTFHAHAHWIPYLLTPEQKQ